MSNRDKVAICGFAPSYKLAPFDDDSFDIWGLNELYAFIPRWDVWFDIHSLGVIKNSSRDGKRLEHLAELDCPVFMRRKYDEVPNSVRYPLAEMTYEFFGGDHRNELHQSFQLYEQGGRELDDEITVGRHGYWTNTVSMMIALAIYEGYNEIHVYGVDMASDKEYKHQRPSCEYMLGFARARGIKVHLPESADLLKSSFVYGYEQEKLQYVEQKMDEKAQNWQEQMEAAKQKRDEAQSAVDQFSGALQARNDFDKLFVRTQRHDFEG